VAGPPDDGLEPPAHERKGFFLRLALGAGYFFGSSDVSVHHESGGQSWSEKEPVDYRGVAQLGEVSLGGTVAPGLVIGGGVYGTNVLATTAKAFDVEESVGLSSTSLVCFFVDSYFVPKNGFHAVAGPCLAVAQAGDKGDTMAGWGLTGGVGYDLWIGGAWSLGLLGRVQYANLPGKPHPLSAVTPGLLIAATYY
jgi:hypothetical protein